MYITKLLLYDKHVKIYLKTQLCITSYIYAKNVRFDYTKAHIFCKHRTHIRLQPYLSALIGLLRKSS